MVANRSAKPVKPMMVRPTTHANRRYLFFWQPATILANQDGRQPVAIQRDLQFCRPSSIYPAPDLTTDLQLRDYRYQPGV